MFARVHYRASPLLITIEKTYLLRIPFLVMSRGSTRTVLHHVFDLSGRRVLLDWLTEPAMFERLIVAAIISDISFLCCCVKVGRGVSSL